jgi:3-methylcrotonyl-CoA carboxylase alpha subunit
VQRFDIDYRQEIFKLDIEQKIDADLDTGFIDKHHAEIFQADKHNVNHEVSIAALFLVLNRQQNAIRHTSENDPFSPWNLSNGWRLNEASVQRFDIEYRQKIFKLEIEQKIDADSRYLIRFDNHEVIAEGELEGHQISSNVDGYRSTSSVAEHEGTYRIFTNESSFQFNELAPDFGESEQGPTGHGLNAPMNGTIVALLVEAGASVAKDEPLIVMEAMKMEHTIRAPASGTVKEFYFQADSLVDGGAELLAFEANES